MGAAAGGVVRPISVPLFFVRRIMSLRHPVSVYPVPPSPLSTVLAARFAPLHRELADACGGTPPALIKSSRRKLQKEYVDLLSRHMGLSLPPHVKGRDLAPIFSADLERRQVDDSECPGWDNLMRELESRRIGEVGRLAEHLRHQAMERAHDPRPRFTDSPLLNPATPLLPQLELEPGELLELLSGCEIDLLGTYSVDHGITLYYARIGLCAEALGISAFDLGLAVYIHELAHLFSHRGLDQDGSDWDTDCFQNSSTYTLESIAQWYTFLAVAGRDEETAFHALLRGQSEPYTAFRVWRHEPLIREYVRMAMIEIRRSYMADNARPKGSLFERVRQLVKFSKELP